MTFEPAGEDGGGNTFKALREPPHNYEDQVQGGKCNFEEY